MFDGNYVWWENFDKLKATHLKINSFNINGLEFNNILTFNNGEILYRSSPSFPNYRKILIENDEVSLKKIEIVNGIYFKFDDNTQYINFKNGLTDIRKNNVTTKYITSNIINNEEEILTKNINCSQKIIAGEIECRGNIKAYYASDIRLKSNIKKRDGALDKIDKISGYTFDMDGKGKLG